MPLKDHRFIDSDFAEMLINVNDIDEAVDIWDKCKPLFGGFEIFQPFHTVNPKMTVDERQKAVRSGNIAKYKSQQISNNKVLRYITLFYDPKSPPNRFINDFVERKVVCAEMAKFEMDDTGTFRDVFNKILQGKNKTVNMMVIYFLRLLNNIDYATLRITLDKYYNEILPSGEFDQIQRTSKFISELTKNFLISEKRIEEAFMKPTLYGIVNKELAEIENLRPERIFELINGDW